jgi:thymidylate synthase
MTGGGPGTGVRVPMETPYVYICTYIHINMCTYIYIYILQEGDLGPVYGFQWRHFGAEYKDMHTDYNNQGVDQLKECIQKIMTSPEDRRYACQYIQIIDYSVLMIVDI